MSDNARATVNKLKLSKSVMFVGPRQCSRNHKYKYDIELILTQCWINADHSALNHVSSETRLHKSRSSRDELEFDLSNFV